MKVKDLIVELQKLPEDAEIGTYEHDDILDHYCEYRLDIQIMEETVVDIGNMLVPMYSSLAKKEHPRKTVYVLE